VKSSEKTMRFVIIATGSWGDVRPNVVLAHALQQAGASVVVVAAEVFRSWVEQRGVPFAGLSVNIQAMLDAQSDSNLLQMMRSLQKLTQATVHMGKEIADGIQAGDVVLLSEGMLPLLNGALENCRVRSIHINLQPWVPTGEFIGMAPAKPAWLPAPEASYNRWVGGMVRRSQWGVMGRNGNRLRTEYLGLPSQTWARHRAALDATPSLLLVSPHVLPRPADWLPHHRVTGYIFEDEPAWEPPHDLLTFLANGSRPVYIGFGSMRERNSQAATQLLLTAARQAGTRAIILSGWAEIGASDLPDNVFLLDYAPHSWLFPRMAAVVHHGGAGTTAAGLRAGVPSIIVPVLSDQPFWGRRLHDLGVGVEPLPRSALTADKLASAITEVVSNQTIQAKAAALGVHIRSEDGLSNAVSAIQECLG
jgi:UDP:flavonoid glycosyltransferase YjiC (YdhE family)